MTRLLALVVVALLGVVACGDDDDVERVEPDPAFTIGVRDAPYRIVYRLDDLSDDRVAATTDEIWVRQPFESRLETSTDGELQGLQISTIDRLRLGSLDQPLVIARVPGLAVSDVRVAPLVEDDIRGVGDRSYLLERREQRIVAGRRCQVLRSGTLLGAGPLIAVSPAEHADSCIDGEGLLLEEVLYQDGKPTLHRVAVEVDTSPRITDDLFDAGDITLPADEGGGSSLPVDPEAGALGPFWTFPDNDPPTGFERVGRFSIIPPQPERFAAGDDPGIVAGTADVFVRGADFVVVYQGGTAGQVDAFPPSESTGLAGGGAVGPGETHLSALGTELRFPQEHGRFVHLIGTIRPYDLDVMARSLTVTEGTGLVYL